MITKAYKIVCIACQVDSFILSEENEEIYVDSPEFCPMCSSEISAEDVYEVGYDDIEQYIRGLE